MSRCSGCGLCVIVVKSRLSVSVTVRRMSWVSVSPITHSSKYFPAIILTPFALSLSKGCSCLCDEKGRAVLRRAQHEREPDRSEEHTSELQSLMRISYAAFCLPKKKTQV